jgi:HSP20 family protein
LVVDIDSLSTLYRTFGSLNRWIPVVDVYQDNEQFVVYTELPGCKKEDLKVRLDGDTLTIEGERKHEVSPDQGLRSLYTERYFGNFQRSVTLPVPVQNVNATYANGILKVVLLKAEESKPNPYDKEPWEKASEFLTHPGSAMDRHEQALEQLRQKMPDDLRVLLWTEEYLERRYLERRIEELEKGLSAQGEAEEVKKAAESPEQLRQLNARWAEEALKEAKEASIRAQEMGPIIPDSTSISRRALGYQRVSRRALIQGNFQRSFVVMLCRAFSMLSGGFLFGSSISHNSLWGSIIGTVVGTGAFALTEVTVRRVEG